MELFIAAALSVICLLTCVIIGRRIENAAKDEFPAKVIIAKVHTNSDFIRANRN